MAWPEMQDAQNELHAATAGVDSDGHLTALTQQADALRAQADQMHQQAVAAEQQAQQHMQASAAPLVVAHAARLRAQADQLEQQAAGVAQQRLAPHTERVAALGADMEHAQNTWDAAKAELFDEFHREPA